MGIFALTRAGRIRRHAIGASLSALALVLVLALAGVVAGGATPAQALSTPTRALSTAAAGPAGGPAGVSCPAVLLLDETPHQTP